MSSIFGQTATPKPSIFDSLNTNTNTSTNTSNIFGQPASSSSSAPTSQAASGGSLFDRITPATTSSTSNIFGAQDAPKNDSIFANLQAPKPSTSNIFGTILGAQGSNTQQTSQPTSSLFGGSTLLGSNSNAQGSSTQQNSGGGLFGAMGQTTNQQNQPQGASLFGTLGENTNQQAQTQGSNLFGTMGQSTNQQNQPQSSSLFGTLGQNAQQQQQAPQQPVPYGTKTVIDQMEAVMIKWYPYSANTLFQTYLYNSINPDQAPFYGPGPSEDESKWEEALRNRPNPATVPTSVRGFRELGMRAIGQRQALDVLHGRLHEIVEGLTAILRKHDLELSTRAVEARRRHLRLSNKCLTLAAKAQLLKNRGYALDGPEEELRKKLQVMERQVFDPALNGRGEEIWARMVSVRERGRQLQREFEKAGRTMEQNQSKEIDGSVFVRCRQILEGYSSQIQHLAKELEQLKKEFTEWEGSRRP